MTPNFVRKPKIWDTTLRDGQQTDGVSFSSEARRVIARHLSNYGVDVIEAGSACKGKREKAAIRGVCAELGSNSCVASFARLRHRDIDAVAESGAGVVALTFPASDAHMRNKLRTGRKGTLDEVLSCVGYALKKGLGVELLAEDASRANPDFLLHAALRTQSAGAGGFCLCDTVGVLLPDEASALFSFLSDGGAKNLSFHGHNDRSLAVANTLAALAAGASGFQATVNGLGERCGNCALEQAALNLHLGFGIRTVALRRTAKLSRLVAELSDFHPAQSQPVVGQNAFTHIAGIHIAALHTGGSALYESYDPALIGARRIVKLGSESGLKGVDYKINELGLRVPRGRRAELLEMVTELGHTSGGAVSDADVMMLARRVCGRRKHERLVLVESHINTGNSTTPTATVRLRINGSRRVRFGASTGDGPVDAAVKAVNQALHRKGVELAGYHVGAVSGGSDAGVRVTMSVRVGRKTIASSETGTDIINTSVAAYIKALNVLL